MANNAVNEALNDVVNLESGFAGDLISMATDFLPRLWVAIIVWILFWFIAKAVRSGITALSTKLWVEKIADKANINDFLGKANMKWGLSGLIGNIAYWIIYLFGINISFNSLGLDVVSDLISDLIAYIPNLFVAVIIMLVGTFIAKFVKDLINGAVAASSSTLTRWGKAGYIAVMFFAVVTALKQAGIDISFLTDNVNTIVMGIMLALGLAFGLGGQWKAKEMLEKRM